MHHVAIMNPLWKLIPKILSGEKSIESRWYLTRRTPWDKAHAGDVIFFKNSSESVTASATVSEVLQFEIRGLVDARRIIAKYGKEIALANADPSTWKRLPNYCVLLRLRDPHAVVKPFQINKKGFGAGAAWITVEDIKSIRIPN